MIVVPVDPVSAFRRLVVDDGVPPPVDPKDVADGGGAKRFYPPAFMARTPEGMLAIRQHKPLDQEVETDLKTYLSLQNTSSPPVCSRCKRTGLSISVNLDQEHPCVH
jgi:hypothetical protein